MSKGFIQDIFTEDALWKKSENGDISILKDKNVSLLKNDLESTPLHYLAEAGRLEVLKHSEVAKVKNNRGSTPLHYLVSCNKDVPKESIQKLFPWYPLKINEKIDKNLITKILNTPNSVRFIYE